MANKLSFLRSVEDKEEFVEITWTRRAIEIAAGTRGTPGKSRDKIFKSEAEVAEAVRAQVERLVADGFAAYNGDVALRLEPAEHVAQTAEQRHTRLCAVPVFSEEPAEDNGSRRGGIPWLAAGESWPTCASCKRPLRFVLQVALADVKDAPGPLPREGLLQVFACDSTCNAQSGWEAFSGANLVRVSDGAKGRLAALPKVVADDADFLVAERRIESWSLLPDLPGPVALQSLVGVDFDTAFEGWERLNEKGLTNRREKIGGWPSWVQDEEKITCAKCGSAPMTFAMQLQETLTELEVLHGNTLYVLSCPQCEALTTVQQR
jgi:hypothetical protein